MNQSTVSRKYSGSRSSLTAFFHHSINTQFTMHKAPSPPHDTKACNILKLSYIQFNHHIETEHGSTLQRHYGLKLSQKQLSWIRHVAQLYYI